MSSQRPTNEIQGLKHIASGKVRDIYAVDENSLLLVASDRISAYDVVLPTPIPDKGRVLTCLSAWWFEKVVATGAHHMITMDMKAMPSVLAPYHEELDGRAMLVRRAEVFPVECVVRGYLSGSGWKDYQDTGAVCGVELPAGLVESAILPEPIFTPATKATSGHDENISFERMVEIIGAADADELRRRSIELYQRGAEHAAKRGIIVADTKFEFGRLPSGDIVIIDEVLTPDSSRFWPADQYAPDSGQPSFDKQFVRDFLREGGWNREPPAPQLPAEVVAGTRDRYVTAFELITGQDFPY